LTKVAATYRDFMSTRPNIPHMPRTFGTAAFLVVLGALLFGSVNSAPAESRTLYNEKGQEIGRSITRGNTTSLKNERGQEIGRADRRPDGSTNYYDASGRMIGSSRGR
jgi:hypothetical protein